MNKEIPFDFILDYLMPLETTIKPFFGMFSVYAGNRLLLILRERNNQPERNGIWIPVNKNEGGSLGKELPALKPISALGSAKGSWHMIHPDEEAFEETAIRLCELIAHGDPRIGRISKPRSGRANKSKESKRDKRRL